jgi:hypothetical protein
MFKIKLNVLLISWALVISTSTYGKIARPLITVVPTERIIKNLEQNLAKNSNDQFSTHIELARILTYVYSGHHSSQSLETYSGDQKFLGTNVNPISKVYFGFAPKPVPLRLQINSQVVTDTAKMSLEKAIDHYQKAIALQVKEKEKSIAHLGLGWCFLEKGFKEKAIEQFRIAFDSALPFESGDKVLFWPWSVALESAEYLLQGLDSVKDKKEINEVTEKKKTLKHVRWDISPIIVPLTQQSQLENLVSNQSTFFDLDGSGVVKKWKWIGPTAGFLVYLESRTMPVTSGQQLFGNVTFQGIWKNGYRALSSLDDDGNGWIENDELIYLFIWSDINMNGQNELGEILSLSELNIQALNTQHITHHTGIPFSPQGLKLYSGTYLPTYDWISTGH